MGDPAWFLDFLIREVVGSDISSEISLGVFLPQKEAVQVEFYGLFEVSGLEASYKNLCFMDGVLHRKNGRTMIKSVLWLASQSTWGPLECQFKRLCVHEQFQPNWGFWPTRDSTYSRLARRHSCQAAPSVCGWDYDGGMRMRAVRKRAQNRVKMAPNASK